MGVDIRYEIPAKEKFVKLEFYQWDYPNRSEFNKDGVIYVRPSCIHGVRPMSKDNPKFPYGKIDYYRVRASIAGENVYYECLDFPFEQFDIIEKKDKENEENN